MSHIPGPRTHPTVKPLATMNRQNLKAWELRLGIIQVVILLGLVTGSLACAFYLGFFTGQRTGFEIALNSTENNAVKLPIDFMDQGDEGVDVDVTSELYAKLSDDKTTELHKKSAEPSRKDVPELKAIKTTDLSPIETDKDWGSLKNENAITDEKKENILATGGNEANKVGKSHIESGAKAPSSNGVIRILGDGKKEDTANNDGSKTLGTLLKENLNKAKEKEKEVSQKNLEASENITGETVHSTQEASRSEQIKVASSETSIKKSSKELSALNSATTKSQAAGTEPIVKNSEAKIGSSTSTKTYLTNAIPKGWFAQVGAPTKLEDAELLGKKLSMSGFRVLVENAKVRGQSYYRVLVGPEIKREQAERLVLQLKSEKYLSGEPFLRLVK